MKLHPVTLALLAASVAPALCAAASDKVTPMTPDGVASYETVRPEADFIKREVMIPMRDGTKLYTIMLMKKGTKNAPILLSRTPYNAAASAIRGNSQHLNQLVPIMDVDYVEDNYIRVYQDLRGVHQSEGEFIGNRPLTGPLNSTGIDESTDAYDTIDWLVKNVPESNGNVGIIGSSYLGFTTLMAEINPHPALKAAAPQSPMVDGWMGDDWFHNGAFRNAVINYSVVQSTAKAESEGTATGAQDDYSRFLEAGSTGDYLKKWGFEHYPMLRKMTENPAYTEFWSLQAVDKILAKQPLKVPTMLIVGQWDQEDSYGAPAVYKAIEPKDKNNDMVSLVIGPWRHSGVNHYGYNLGALTFTGDTAKEFRLKYMKPFFDHHLKGAPDPKTPPVLTYATGENKWNVSPKWPMGTPQKLYVNADMGLSFKPDGNAKAHDDYVADPAKPVPFVPRPINLNDSDQWRPWLVHDQRFASSRPDVLVYTSEVLDKPLHIMGAPLVNLFASTTGTDADWVVKLIDVYPNTTSEGHAQGYVGQEMTGFELAVGLEAFRGRYVHGFASPAPLTPGKVEHYQFALPNVDHVFLPGHKLMIQVQSSLFPLYDRNPQTYVDNIFWAKPQDYQKATMSVFHNTNIELPIVK
ncbi:CocE/NonD family hydrolase [Shewanella sp. C32]|uniref:CocE/NonD family hydrolase n=1 Tax=Shewanella electrica TaxID=515560 RepID=A0ABT2FQG4_9GAMM|nr:CocE/NonD family hydrolase [Shewanella electrica]MCH1926975.1 CocE/NonD family hydrolase [Shewanella electrica]MCS4558596.1 CocE/NonD family hydrolase [Shewanella electrica]